MDLAISKKQSIIKINESLDKFKEIYYPDDNFYKHSKYKKLYHNIQLNIEQINNKDDTITYYFNIFNIYILIYNYLLLIEKKLHIAKNINEKNKYNYKFITNLDDLHGITTDFVSISVPTIMENEKNRIFGLIKDNNPQQFIDQINDIQQIKNLDQEISIRIEEFDKQKIGLLEYRREDEKQIQEHKESLNNKFKDLKFSDKTEKELREELQNASEETQEIIRKELRVIELEKNIDSGDKLDEFYTILSELSEHYKQKTDEELSRDPNNTEDINKCVRNEIDNKIELLYIINRKLSQEGEDKISLLEQKNEIIIRLKKIKGIVPEFNDKIYSIILLEGSILRSDTQPMILQIQKKILEDKITELLDNIKYETSAIDKLEEKKEELLTEKKQFEDKSLEELKFDPESQLESVLELQLKLEKGKDITEQEQDKIELLTFYIKKFDVINKQLEQAIKVEKEAKEKLDLAKKELDTEKTKLFDILLKQSESNIKQIEELSKKLDESGDISKLFNEQIIELILKEQFKIETEILDKIKNQEEILQNLRKQRIDDIKKLDTIMEQPNLSDLKTALQPELQKLTAELDRLRESEAESLTELQKLKAELQKSQTELQESQEELQKLKAESKEELQKSQEELEKLKAESEAKLKKSQTDLQVSKEELQKLKAKSVTELQESKEELQKLKAESKEELQKLKAESEAELQKSVAELQESKEKLKA